MKTRINSLEDMEGKRIKKILQTMGTNLHIAILFDDGSVGVLTVSETGYYKEQQLALRANGNLNAVEQRRLEITSENEYREYLKLNEERRELYLELKEEFGE